MSETTSLYYRVASYISSNFFVQFTTVFHFYYLLHPLHNSRTTISTTISHSKPCAYRVTCLSLMNKNLVITLITVTI